MCQKMSHRGIRGNSITMTSEESKTLHLGGGDAGSSRKGRRSRSDLPVLRSAPHRRSGERRRARERKGRPCARRGRPEGRAAGPRTGNGAHPRTVRPDRADRKGARRGAGQALQDPHREVEGLSLIHISEPTRLGMISYAVFCLKKKKIHFTYK